jgi:trans-aconitate methyltransferase
LGCGTGQLASMIASRRAQVLGIDRSVEMVEQARRNHANQPGLRFELADATTFTADAPFDAIFSNAVLHWVRPAEAAVDRMWRALRPGGRLVAEFGGRGNINAVCDAIRQSLAELGAAPFEGCDPWYFPSISEYTGVLEQRGFEATLASLFDRPTPLDGGDGAMRNWLRMFGGNFLAALPTDRQEAFLNLTSDLLRPALFRDGQWWVDHRRLQVVARKPS